MKTVEIDGIKYQKVIEKAAKDEKPFVMVRTYSAGVHFGYIEKRDDINKIIKLSNARRVWSWSGAFTLSELSTEGPKNPNECKFSVEVPEIELQWVEIIPITDEASKILNKIEPYDC